MLVGVEVAVGATVRVAGHVRPNLGAYHAAFLAAAAFAVVSGVAALRIDDREAAATIVPHRRTRARAGEADEGRVALAEG